MFGDWLQQQGYLKTLGKARMRELLAEPFMHQEPWGLGCLMTVKLQSRPAQDMALFDRSA